MKRTVTFKQLLIITGIAMCVAVTGIVLHPDVVHYAMLSRTIVEFGFMWILIGTWRWLGFPK